VRTPNAVSGKRLLGGKDVPRTDEKLSQKNDTTERCAFQHKGQLILSSNCRLGLTSAGPGDAEKR
jgi:hypothetical protein